MSNLRWKVEKFAKRNAATILTFVGAAGVVVTSIAAVKGTTKAVKLLEQAEKEKGEELSKKEIVKVAGPSYIPAVVIGVSTIACIFGANVLNKKTQAALSSAYALIDQSYKDYKRKLVELHGEEMHQEIVDAIAVEKADKVYLNANNLAGSCYLDLDEDFSDPVLFYDEYGNRYFESTIEKVITAEYHLNRNYVLRGSTDLNELYEFLGLEPTDYGAEVGWCTGSEIYWIDFNHRKVVMEDGLECYIIEMPFGPMADYEYY